MNSAIKVIKYFRKTALCKENGHEWVFTLGKGFYIGDHYVCKQYGKIEWIDEETE